MKKFYRNSKITALIAYVFLFLSNAEGMESYENLNDFNREEINHQTVKLFLENNVDTYSKLMDSSKGKDIVVFLGNTGSGKSTLVNYLSSKPLKCTGYQRIELVNPHDQGAMVIGNGDQSQTLLPKYTLITGSNLLFYDLPGFHDNRGSLINLLNASFIKNIIENARTTRCVFVVGVDELTASRGESIKKLLGISKSLIPGHSIESMSCLVITKSQAANMEELLETLETKCPGAMEPWRRGNQNDFSLPYYDNRLPTYEHNRPTSFDDIITNFSRFSIVEDVRQHNPVNYNYHPNQTSRTTSNSSPYYNTSPAYDSSNIPSSSQQYSAPAKVGHMYMPKKGEVLTNKDRAPIINLIKNTIATKINKVNIGVIYSDQDQRKLQEVFKKEIIEISKGIIQRRSGGSRQLIHNSHTTSSYISPTYGSYPSSHYSTSLGRMGMSGGGTGNGNYSRQQPVFPSPQTTNYNGGYNNDMQTLQNEKNFYEYYFLQEVLKEFKASRLTCLLKPIAKNQYEVSETNLNSIVQPDVREQLYIISQKISEIKEQERQRKLKEVQRQMEEQRLRQAEERQRLENRRRYYSSSYSSSSSSYSSSSSSSDDTPPRRQPQTRQQPKREQRVVARPIPGLWTITESRKPGGEWRIDGLPWG